MILREGNRLFLGVMLCKYLLFTFGFSLLVACESPADDAPQALSNAPVEEEKNATALPPNHPQKADSIDQLLHGLIKKLEAQPDDVDGWLLLAKSYRYLGEPELATSALSKARDLGYEGPDIGAKSSSMREASRNGQIQAEHASRYFREPIYQAMEELVMDPAKTDQQQ